MWGLAEGRAWVGLPVVTCSRNALSAEALGAFAACGGARKGRAAGGIFRAADILPPSGGEA
jgi:hypothetical protein